MKKPTLRRNKVQEKSTGVTSGTARPPATSNRRRFLRNILIVVAGLSGFQYINHGDTLSVLDAANAQHKIRLYGIDTPERDQPHGKIAWSALSELVAGRSVGIVEVETDSYGRTVGTVYLGDQNVNLAMVEQGHAWWYRRHAQYERPLEAAEKQARREGLGLWADSNPIPPWEWRRRY